jgi:CRP/FNR family transcriptional regulator, dissimilatory nitrate respiration regulator
MKPLIPNIGPNLLTALEKRGTKRTFDTGQEAFSEGAAAEFLPIVISGRVKMFHFLEPGKEVIIGIFGEGEMFAVPPVFDGGRYPSTAVAMEKTRLLMITRRHFMDLLRESSEFSFAVIDWMCEMLREKTGTIQNLATASPDHRVGNVLLKLAEKESGGSSVKIMLRRQDIARIAGLTTETTIRVIRRLAERGFIRIDHGKIVLDSTAKLQDFLAYRA